MYRRNRYYDPEAGQFTQQDPIGIAGGLNLYGYAGGDPINFSDPFGLDPCEGSSAWTECLAQGLADWGASNGSESFVLAGAALNAFFEATGFNAAASAGDAIGSGDLGEGGVGLAMTFVGGPSGGALSRGIARTVARAQGAEVAFSQLGRFTRAVWEVAGDKGAGYVRWNRILGENGSTVRLFKDVYDQAGDFLRRDWYVGGP
jgi:uncharacterized protein RhaS with RHS repeats